MCWDSPLRGELEDIRGPIFIN
ncbi:hypothetical protein N7529_010972 [Penicillium soppii]|nr:hypothetical protein N7529_010972 [Penicillium soppii]